MNDTKQGTQQHRQTFQIFSEISLAFTGIIIAIVFEYQSHFEGVLRQSIVDLFVRMLTTDLNVIDEETAGRLRQVTDLTELIKFAETRELPSWLRFFLWPHTGTFFFSLPKKPHTNSEIVATLLLSSPRWAVLLIPLLLVILSRIRDVFSWYTREEPLDFNSEPAVELTSWIVNFPSDTSGNGFVFEFEGNKPPGKSDTDEKKNSRDVI